MHVMKILYMASIYGLVTEIKRTIKKIYFYSGFYEETAAKQFFKKFTVILQRFLPKNRCKM
jgi:hypothetical protein